MTIHYGRGRVEFFDTNEAPFRGVNMPRENCCIYLSHRDMSELLRAMSYVWSTREVVRSAGSADPRQSLWGFPVITTEAARSPVMMMRWGDRSATRGLTVEQLMNPGMLDETSRLLENDVIESSRRVELERQLNNFYDYSAALRRHDEEIAGVVWKGFEPQHVRMVVNRRSKIRSIIIEKET